MRRAHFLRAKESELDAATNAFQIAVDFGEAVFEVPPDVFNEHEIRVRFLDDAVDIGPDVPRVFGSKLLARAGERLARESGKDAMNASAPGVAVERGHIAPHRCWSQGTAFHFFDQAGDAMRFDLHIQNCASVWHCQAEADISGSAAGADRDDAEFWGGI